MSRVPRLVVVTAALALASATLTACSPDGGARTQGAGSSSCAGFESFGTFTESPAVTVATALSGLEAERFDASVAQFESCTGIDVVQQSSSSMELSLRSYAEAASGPSATPQSPEAPETPAVEPGTQDQLPDLALVPQPGLVDDLASAGVIEPLPDEVNANIELGWEDSWAEAGMVGGVPYGAPVMASVKSLVWFSPAAFAAAGYKVPQTWNELETLTEKIASDHPDGDVSPWCLGVEDGESTGWVLTDWLEDTMLATEGTDVYDQWASHSTSLASGGALSSLGELDKLLFAQGHVLGGREGAMSTSLETSVEQLASGQCLMLHASSSIESLLPVGTLVTDLNGKNGVTVSAAPSEQATGDAEAETEQTEPAPATEASASPGAAPTELSAFLLPSSDGDEEETAVMVGGDYLVATHLDQATSAVLSYLTSADWAQRRIDLGGAATANRLISTSTTSSPVVTMASGILTDRQRAVRLDASDSMPSTVGTKVLWISLSAWGSGTKTPRQALGEAEAAWPR